jgi:hypothetical protein
MHLKLVAFAGIAAVGLATMPSSGNESAWKVTAEQAHVTYIGAVDKTFRVVQPSKRVAVEKRGHQSARPYTGTNIRIVGTPFLPVN